MLRTAAAWPASTATPWATTSTAMRMAPLPGRLARMRHGSVWAGEGARGDGATLVFSRIGDMPERLLAAPLDVPALLRASSSWVLNATRDATTLAAPVEAYEGADLAVGRSTPGAGRGLRRELRDPFVLDDGQFVRDAGGAGRVRRQLHLFYACGGETAICGGVMRRKACD